VADTASAEVVDGRGRAAVAVDGRVLDTANVKAETAAKSRRPRRPAGAGGAAPSAVATPA
jgi:ribosomal protein L24E